MSDPTKSKLPRGRYSELPKLPKPWRWVEIGERAERGDFSFDPEADGIVEILCWFIVGGVHFHPVATLRQKKIYRNMTKEQELLHQILANEQLIADNTKREGEVRQLEEKLLLLQQEISMLKNAR